jgi:hypothetical protein
MTAPDQLVVAAFVDVVMEAVLNSQINQATGPPSPWAGCVGMTNDIREEWRDHRPLRGTLKDSVRERVQRTTLEPVPISDRLPAAPNLPNFSGSVADFRVAAA